MTDAPPPAPPGPARWPHRRAFRATYHDIDALNHLNHAAYFPWMETLRCEYYLPLLGTDDPTRLDIIVAEATARYLRPVAYGEEVEGEVAPARPLGRTSFVLLYRFSKRGSGSAGKEDGRVEGGEEGGEREVVARGRTVIVTYDYARGAPTPIPPDRRAALERDAVDPASDGW